MQHPTEEEERSATWPNWLWILMIVALAALLVIWLMGTWEVESEVKTGASEQGLTFPANPGVEVRGGEAAPAAEVLPEDAISEDAVDVTLPGGAPGETE